MKAKDIFPVAHSVDKSYTSTMWLNSMIILRVPSLEKWTWQGTTRSSPHDSDQDDPLKRFLIFKFDSGINLMMFASTKSLINQSIPQHKPRR
jgi:hypothetical protein